MATWHQLDGIWHSLGKLGLKFLQLKIFKIRAKFYLVSNSVPYEHLLRIEALLAHFKVPSEEHLLEFATQVTWGLSGHEVFEVFLGVSHPLVTPIFVHVIMHVDVQNILIHIQKQTVQDDV